MSQPRDDETGPARGLLARLALARLLRRFPERLVWAAFMLVNGFVTITAPTRRTCWSSRSPSP